MNVITSFHLFHMCKTRYISILLDESLVVEDSRLPQTQNWTLLLNCAENFS